MKEIAAFLSGSISLWLLFPVMFGDKEEFMSCVKFWFTPDIVSLFRGEYWENDWAEFKLFIWVGCSAAIAYGVYHLF